MHISGFLSLRFLFLTLIISNCQELNKSNPVYEQSPRHAETHDIHLSEIPGKPYLGFNSKASLETQSQVGYVDALLSDLPIEIKQNLTVRLPGGTISQKVYSVDFSDSDINSWVSLQRKHSIRFVFVVNGNDSPKNQKDFIERWINAGARFDFIEMMNEYYLQKYRQGKTEISEVSQKVTSQSYVDEILPAFFEELDDFNLPYFIICAPEKSGKSGEYMDQWNNEIVKALNGKYKDLNMGIVLHLYKKGVNGDFDYSQINRLRNRIGPNTKVAITEMGVLDSSVSYSEIANSIGDHYVHIFKQLGEGDYMFDQVLFNNYRKDNAATLHPSTNGLTPKGEKVIEFIRKAYE